MTRQSRLAARCALLVILLVTAGGCAVPADRASDRPERPERPPAASSALGDLRTIDPCTLISPDDLAGVGRARNAGTVSLDYCLLHVRPADDTLVQLAVGELHRVDAAKLTRGRPVERRGPVRVVGEPPVPGHCSRRILFSDGVAMSVSVDLLTGDPAAGLCAVAEAGVRGAVRVIARGAVGHRTFPADSLALIDPCTVLDTGVVRRVPGLAEASPQRSPARHQCRWGRESPRSASVRVVHTAGRPPQPLHGAAVTEHIAGRRTVVSIVGGDPRVPLCTAETGHVPFGEPGSGQVEVAMIVVSLPEGDGIRACEYARGLAERVWPRLPPSRAP